MTRLFFAMDLTLLKHTLIDTGVLSAIQAACGDEMECYLVGGAIRDCLAGRVVNDFDFCFPVNPTEYAEKIAERLGATFFVLDTERGHSRFVIKQGGQKLTCDFAPFRSPSLESDLRKRDFTINAMAVACNHGDFVLIDPLHGQDDLFNKLLRGCSEYSFQEDPLRCLKGIRHAVTMGLEFTPETMEALVEAVPQIDQVASERIRSELAKAVAGREPIKTFELLGLCGLHTELFGPSSPEAFAAGLVHLREHESIISLLRTGACGQVVVKYLAESCEENVSIEVALRMAAFFYGYRPVALKSVLNALRFSRRTVNLISQLQNLNSAIMNSYNDVAGKSRSRARWLANLGQEPLASALFLPLIATGTVQDNLLQTELLIDSYVECSVEGKLRELVDGNWLTAEMGIEVGPDVGRMLSLVHEVEISGEATTTEEAKNWLLAKQKSIDKDFDKNL